MPATQARAVASDDAANPAGPADDLVIVFSPHPDDDVIACGGTIARLSQAGSRVVTVYVTDGSMSHSAVLGIDEDPSPAELVEIRQEEARAAAKIVGVAAQDVHFLGFPDTRLADHLPGCAAAVRDVLARHAGVAEVYLPHEVHELNADHRLTGETVLRCLAELRLAPRLRKFVVWDERTETEFGFVNRNPAGHAAAAGEVLLRVDVGGFAERKRAALAEHRSQVTLLREVQTRPVVPPQFQARVLTRGVEEFWTEAAG